MVTQGGFQGHSMILCVWWGASAELRRSVSYTNPRAPRPRAVSPASQYRDPVAPVSSKRNPDGKHETLHFQIQNDNISLLGAVKYFSASTIYQKCPRVCLIDYVCMIICFRCVIYDVILEISSHAQRPEATDRQHVQTPSPPRTPPHPCLHERMINSGRKAVCNARSHTRAHTGLCGRSNCM